MKLWKPLIGIVLGLLIMATGVASADEVQTATYTVDNTIIVLPTTKVVNNIPLHINEDAIAGARIGAWLMYKSIFIQPQDIEKTITAEAEYHSVVIRDSDQMYYLNSIDMPDVDLPLADVPDEKHISVYVNFSRVTYNTTSSTYSFGDGAVGVIFTTNSSPIKLWDTDNEALVKMNSNNTELYVYTFNSDSRYQKIGDTYNVDGLQLVISDISTDSNRVLVEVIPPSGTGDEFSDILELNSVNVYYIDSEGKFVKSDTTDVNQLLSSGAQKVYEFKVSDIFTGINYNMARIDSTYYDKIKEYKDGQVYMGNWVWHIINESTFELKLHVDPDNHFPEVVLSQDAPELKLPVGDIVLKAYWVVNDAGNIVDHYFRFVKPVMVTEKVQYQTQVVSYSRPENIIWTDEQFVSAKPTNKNVIIVGGWVSNKAWTWLTQAFGEDTVSEWQNTVEANGYIVKVAEYNGVNIVILAGKDYTGTAYAVDYFIHNILLQS